MTALRTTSNINTLIRDLMHTPPSYKATVRLSWKAQTEATAPAQTRPTATKRPSLDNKKEVANKGPKTHVLHMDREVYAPPTGKFSDKAGSAPTGE